MNHAQFWGGGGAAPYQIEQSLRFDGTGRFSRSMGAGDRRTATISCWLKSSFDRAWFIDAAGGSNNASETTIYMGTSSIGVGRYDSSWGSANQSNRDPSAWYHVLWVLDTNNSTGSDRIRVYVNGVRRPFTFSFTPSQGEQLAWNNSTPLYIGHRQQIPTSSGDYYRGYLAEMYHVDGTALDPTDFGEFDDNGVWRPIEATGLTFGTNGFYLKFDPSATNGIGHDHSGNGNHFTPTGFTTSGAGTDVMSDTPTTNYATLNPLDTSRDMDSSFYLGNGNLNLSVTNNSSYRNLGATFSPEGQKGYFEITWTSGSPNFYIGFMPIDRSGVRNKNDYQYTGRGYGLWSYGDVEQGVTDVWTSYLSSFGSSDTLQIAFDFTGGNRNVWFGRNNTWGSTSGGTGNPATGANPALTATQLTGEQAFSFAINTGAGTQTIACNFGQRAFNYTPPTGFNALNTSNLPAPDIADGSDYFDILTWTGDSSGATRTFSGLAFQPDLVWAKGRNQAISHQLTDAVRGAGATSLRTDDTRVEGADGTSSGYLSAFTSDGFTSTSSSTNVYYNTNTYTYVAWNWLAGGSGSSNTDGSITSTVSANPSAGFSIVTYAGSGTGGDSIGHGLGVPPKMIIAKSRGGGPYPTASWAVYHESIGASKSLALDTTAAAAGPYSNPGTIWYNTTPTSTVFYVGNLNETNGSNNYVAYCFAEVEGYSKFGSYTGNGPGTGSAYDGPFIYTGFTPKYFLYKTSSNNAQWQVVDSTRGGDAGENNPVSYYLVPNASDGEVPANSSNYGIDFCSNGIKIRTGNVYVNNSGWTYIYAAFAENPFGGSGVSPATAR